MTKLITRDEQQLANNLETITKSINQIIFFNCNKKKQTIKMKLNEILIDKL